MGEVGLLPLDIPTLALSRGVMQMMLAGLLIYAGSQQVRGISARLWAAGFLLNGLSLFLFVLVVPEHLEPWVIAGNHISVALGITCILQGFWQFNGQPSRTWILAGIFLLLMLVLVVWTFVWPNARLRVLGSATGQALYLFVLQQALRVPPRREVQHIYRRLRWVVIAYLLVFVWSYASIADVLPAGAHVSPAYHRSFFSVASLLFMLTLAVSCLALKFAVLAARNADLAMVDWLTGLLNRRGFFLAAERECGRPVDSMRCMSIVVIDIDFFKRINDKHGHAAGDEVLKALATVLVELTGCKNHVARTGGEEFCILLTDASLEKALLLAESMRVRCEELRIATDGAETITFTISAGVSQIGPCETIDQAIIRADDGLYAAKRDGRNRVAEGILDQSVAYASQRGRV